ncbi:MAG: hypothetical protein M1832_000030 [Thelocarpon impressellum]|nr:MAG: hypothetical protein M1832_000030 [Thelocarpon impressellum]
MAAGFFAPAIVEEYASHAVVIKPTKLSVDSFTPNGVRARVQGTLVLDASRVHNAAVRRLGRAGTWIARAIESKPSTLRLYVPQYGNLLLGTATVPRIVVTIRDGEVNHIDFLTDIEPGEMDGIRKLANQWLEGDLGQLQLRGKADVAITSGIFSLGTQSISESLVFEGHDLPAIPKYNITRMLFHEAVLPNGQKGMAADASLTLKNDYPVKLTIPPLGFDILVPNCAQDDPYLLLADATTATIEVEPRKDVRVDVGGIVRQLPDALKAACPDSNSSPLDALLGNYLHGQDTTIFVRGSNAPSSSTPQWIAELMSSVTVPLPFPGHTFDNLMKNFSLADVHFKLPDPMAEPGTPESQPRLSAIVKALINVPEQVNFPINVSRVRADADVYYHNKKLGRLDLHKWQSANSSRIEAHGDDLPSLLVQSFVNNAPLNITDDDVFTEVVQALLFGGKGVSLGIKADVDVEVKTALGGIQLKKIPAEGKVAVKPVRGGVASLAPKVDSLRILDTTETTLLIQARVNFTNPTEYSAHIPFLSINILENGTALGQATAKDVTVVPGSNENVVVEAVWDPLTPSGSEGQAVGRELLSQYISGWNTTISLKTHEGSIPSQPALGRALSMFEVELATPRIKYPGAPDKGDGEDGGEDGPHFIEDATLRAVVAKMHLFSSTATFTLLSPLTRTTLFITYINATALYNHTDPVGTITYDLPFAVAPIRAHTPRLPVDWSLDSVGYDAVRSALGGRLKLDARAVVGVKVAKFEERLWYIGHGIGAKVRV